MVFGQAEFRSTDARPIAPLQSRAVPAPLATVCFALCWAHAIYIAASIALGQWPDGGGTPGDFIGVWATGRLVLSGLSANAYDWAILDALQHEIAGRDFFGFYGWHYPPPFLFVAGALSLFPYAAALVVWMVVSFLPYMMAVRAIVGHRIGYLLAGAVPPLLANVVIGQNGFFTSALIGGTLGLMEKHPLAAGCCLGVLTYKPQFGLLFPLVLIASSRWKVFAAASVVAALLAVASWVAFGTAAWDAFFTWLPRSSQRILSEGQADWGKLHSLYAVVRVLGGGDSVAWLLQGGLAAATAGALCLLWRSRVAFLLKAAALSIGIIFATPYIYLYDMVMIAVPVAFLMREGIATGFRAYELPALGMATAMLVAFPLFKLPLGFAAAVIVAGLIGARVWASLRRGRSATNMM